MQKRNKGSSSNPKLIRRFGVGTTCMVRRNVKGQSTQQDLLVNNMLYIRGYQNIFDYHNGVNFHKEYEEMYEKNENVVFIEC
jgi:hypothetical protein